MLTAPFSPATSARSSLTESRSLVSNRLSWLAKRLWREWSMRMSIPQSLGPSVVAGPSLGDDVLAPTESKL